MVIPEIFFYIFAFMVLGVGCIVAFSTNLVHSAFALFFALFGMAGFYVLLGGDFVAMVQIMVYAGGVAVLLIFGTMLTADVSEPETSNLSFQGLLSFFGGVGLLGVLMAVLDKTEWPLAEFTQREATTKTLGNLLLKDYLLPFEVISFLLLIAMVGGIFIILKGGDEA